jgi:tRNA-dihydrouridine synthase
MSTIDFSTPLYVLAPLAGFTDLPFRSVVKKFGVDLTVSEMISSNALVHNSKKTYKMLEKSPVEECVLEEAQESKESEKIQESKQGDEKAEASEEDQKSEDSKEAKEN